jgi:hypothetical protein
MLVFTALGALGSMVVVAPPLWLQPGPEPANIYKSSPVRLSLKETDEWEDYFNTYKVSISGLIAENQRLKEGLDKMVFDLYNVSEKQRQIIVRSLGS